MHGVARVTSCSGNKDRSVFFENMKEDYDKYAEASFVYFIDDDKKNDNNDDNDDNDD